MGVYSGALIEVLRDLYDTGPLADELARISRHVRSVPEGRGFSPAIIVPPSACLSRAARSPSPDGLRAARRRRIMGKAL